MSLFLHSLRALAAACSSDYLSDCASFFLHSLTAFAAAPLIVLLVRVRISFLSHMDSFGSGLLVRLLITFLILVDCFCVGSPVGLIIDSFRWGSLVGLLVAVTVSFFSPVNGFYGGSLLTLLRGHPLVCEFSCLPIAYGFTDVLHTAVMLMAVPTICMPCLSNCNFLLRVCFLTLVDGFWGSLLITLLVGLLVRLRVSFLVLVDSFHGGFRGGSLAGLLVGFLVTFLTLVDEFPGILLVG